MIWILLTHHDVELFFVCFQSSQHIISKIIHNIASEANIGSEMTYLYIY